MPHVTIENDNDKPIYVKIKKRGKFKVTHTIEIYQQNTDKPVYSNRGAKIAQKSTLTLAIPSR